MTQVTVLAAKARESVGKGTARAIRRNNEVPAVIYGDKIPPVTISMEYKLLMNYVNKAAFFTTLFDIEINGKKHHVLPRDVQFHPVTDRPLHVDFLRVSANTKVRVQVPVIFTNMDKSPGIKRGGTLNIVRHTVEMLVPADNIPESITGDLAGLDINDGLHISHFKLPENCTPTIRDRDFTVATIAPPTTMAEEPAAAAAAPAAAAKAPAKDEKKK